MRNRQSAREKEVLFNSTLQNEPQRLRRKELELLSSDMGVKPELRNGSVGKCSDVLTGSWEFHSRENTVKLHYGTFKALHDISVSFKLPPGLSLTIMFEGALDIVIGTHPYTIGTPYGLARCAAFCVARPEVVTRHQSSLKSVHKLNLFVERDWLQSFCKSPDEINCLNQIFKQPCILNQWLPDKHVLATASKIMRPGKHSGFMAEIERESSVFLLLSLMLKNYMNEIKAKNTTPLHRPLHSSDHEPVKMFLDNLSSDTPSLDILAEKFNVSVSTLQRRFKAHHGITVMNYLRQKNLDNAKMHLTENHLSIGEIAFICGYKHSSNFINAFIKQFEISPGCFRSIHKNN